MRILRVALIAVAACLIGPRVASAQMSCEGPNGCSLQVRVNALVLSTRIPSIARVAVRAAGTPWQAQVATRTNTGLSMSIAPAATSLEPVQVRTVGNGGTVTPVETRRGGVVVVTLAAS